MTKLTVAYENIFSNIQIRKYHWLLKYCCNAELLSIAALYQLRAVDAEATAGKINNSINECLLAIGDSSWRKFESRDRSASPYVCGLALHIAIAAAYQQQHERDDVFSLWRAVWRESPSYDEGTVLAFMRKTGLHIQATRLSNLLVSEDSFRTVLLRMFFGAGLPTVLETSAPEALKNSLARNLFSALMRLDCAGAVGFFAYPEYLQVEGIKGCQSLTSGMKVSTIQGADILRAPESAVMAVRAACTANKAIDIDTHDGLKVSLACNAADLGKIPSAFQAIRVESKGLQNLLGR